MIRGFLSFLVGQSCALFAYIDFDSFFSFPDIIAF